MPPRLELLAQMVAALIERELRQTMAEKKIGQLFSLPEGRASKTPTIEQVLRLFEHQSKHALYEGEHLIQQFAKPLRRCKRKFSSCCPFDRTCTRRLGSLFNPLL